MLSMAAVAQIKHRIAQDAEANMSTALAFMMAWITIAANAIIVGPFIQAIKDNRFWINQCKLGRQSGGFLHALIFFDEIFIQAYQVWPQFLHL